jgi:hypothetical protein
MQFRTRGFMVAAGIALCGLTAPVMAQLPPPPPPPTTLWSFLGIPQAYRSIRDGRSNRNGNRPQAERKPPLKAIADPKNLESPDPAIKKAAEVKMAEDLKQQKIKAVRYLASIGCGCYNRDGSITDALLKSMDDCTEDVRLATVRAIAVAAAGEQCANCKQRSCCSEEISNKLYEIAYEKDDTRRRRCRAASGPRPCRLPVASDLARPRRCHSIPARCPRFRCKIRRPRPRRFCRAARFPGQPRLLRKVRPSPAPVAGLRRSTRRQLSTPSKRRPMRPRTMCRRRVSSWRTNLTVLPHCGWTPRNPRRTGRLTSRGTTFNCRSAPKDLYARSTRQRRKLPLRIPPFASAEAGLRRRW